MSRNGVPAHLTVLSVMSDRIDVQTLRFYVRQTPTTSRRPFVGGPYPRDIRTSNKRVGRHRVPTNVQFLRASKVFFTILVSRTSYQSHCGRIPFRSTSDLFTPTVFIDIIHSEATESQLKHERDGRRRRFLVEIDIIRIGPRPVSIFRVLIRAERTQRRRIFFVIDSSSKGTRSTCELRTRRVKNHKNACAEKRKKVFFRSRTSFFKPWNVRSHKFHFTFKYLRLGGLQRGVMVCGRVCTAPVRRHRTRIKFIRFIIGTFACIHIINLH